jgi:NifB/MoaA-like Fe-S oxidoreductase
MPMKRSGRSVEAASRVIEIEDVLLLGRCFDHEITFDEIFERIGRRDALDRGLTLFVADALAADLPRQVAVDGGNPLGDAVGDDVVEQNVIA